MSNVPLFTLVPLALSLALAAPSVGCSSNARGEVHGSTPTAEPAPIPLAVAPVRTHDFEARYHASATLRGHNTAIITSKTQGFVRRLLVKTGSRVRAGQLLAVLASKELEAGVQRAHAAIAEAQQARLEADGAIEAAAANQTLAQLSYERSSKLLEASAVTRHDFDQATAQRRATGAQHAMASARQRAADARIAQAKAALAEAEANLSYTRVTAPFSGRVIEQRIDPGNLASPGTPLLVLEQAGRFRAEASVEEALVGRVHANTRATVRIDALDREVDGRVSEIVPAVDVGSRAFLVKVELPESLLAHGAQPGLYARVSFRLGVRPRLAVPFSAIAPWGQLDRVFVVEGGRAHARIVTLGERQGDVVEVLSGLDAGEALVTRPPSTLRDGTPVRAEAPTPAAPAATARDTAPPERPGVERPLPSSAPPSPPLAPKGAPKAAGAVR